MTLQDISVRLMKPAKDLADWKFPLSQILEEYYALLEEPCSVNFGEAALVLQNSANVYVRRVECLFNEMELLKQMFFTYEIEDAKKSTCKEKKSIKKAYIDFESFAIIDLEREVGKNLDKKNQSQMRKKIKLLSQRFTQLESNATQLHVPIEVYDIYGEVVGKKYDFRCNQSVNVNGMLVDELTPVDFARALGSRVQNGRNPSSISSEPKTPGTGTMTGTSGYHSIASPCKSITPTNEEFEEQHDSSLEMNHEESLLLQDDTDQNSAGERENLATFRNTTILNQTALQRDLLEEQQSNQFLEELTEKSDPLEKRSLVNEPDVLKEEASNERISSYEENVENMMDVNVNSSIVKKEVIVEVQKKRNQTTRMAICTVNDVNEREWKSMPLTRGPKNLSSDNSSPLKLPDYLSLLKTKLGSRKRKLSSKMRKPECVTRFVLREGESNGEKENTDALTKPSFRRLRKQELEDFMKSFDECLNGAEEELEETHYEAVTGVVAMDLLGFRLCQGKNDDIEENAEEENEEEASGSPFELYEPPNSPSSCNESFQTDFSYSLPDYQTLVEDRMKEIFRESDVTTELEHTVAKWHASLQPKLSEAELRPAFRIHDYASRIIGTLQALDQRRINFDNVVRGKPACEVARYFLASLQLANAYNVEIQTKETGSGIELALLDTERVEDYRQT